ncbi:MAG: DUF5993 family protein [Fluviibacter sp.]|jgi:hypothetical protein
MYIIFLIALIAVILILTGHRSLGVTATLLTTAVLAGLLVHHMTDKLPISL